MRTINVRKLLDCVGGKVDAQSLLASEGCVVTMKAIDKWVSRNSIPAYALCAFLIATARRNIQIDLDKLSYEN